MKKCMKLERSWKIKMDNNELLEKINKTLEEIENAKNQKEYHQKESHLLFLKLNELQTTLKNYREIYKENIEKDKNANEIIVVN